MEQYFVQIEQGLAGGAYFLAIVATLAIPDICAALDSPNRENTKAKYCAWYERWLGPKYPGFSGLDMYYLRCGVVHQGILSHPKMRVTRVVFHLPNSEESIVHMVETWNIGSSKERVLTLNVDVFCRDVIKSAREWLGTNKNDALIAFNMLHVFQFRPDGLPPHIVGTPVIA